MAELNKIINGYIKMTEKKYEIKLEDEIKEGLKKLQEINDKFRPYEELLKEGLRGSNDSVWDTLEKMRKDWVNELIKECIKND